MIPTIDYIQAHFDAYNSRFWGGSLPPVPVKLSHAKGFLGKVTFTRRRQGLFGGYRNENFVLRINARIDLPEELVQDTILHEMIHYYIAVNQWRDNSSHGELFRREMKRINAEGNRHITISHRLTESQRTQAVRHKTRAVAIVHFEDGKTGIKVVPNKPQHIQYWHRAVMRTFNRPFSRLTQISRIEWLLSDTDYFARFPSSVAMRVYLIDNPSELPLTKTKNEKNN